METEKVSRLVVVTVKYEAGHSYDYTYRETEYYCPFCGKNEVFEQDSSEYDPTNVCLACGEDFRWRPGIGGSSNETRQVVEQIKAAVHGQNP